VWSAYDLDMGMKPTVWASKADLSKFFDEAMGMMKKAGGTWSWRTTKLECKASGALGICIIEGDSTMTMPKMPPMMASMRSTEVFAKEKGGWKWMHHHTSAARDPLPSKFMATSTKAASGWMDGPPDMAGIKLLPVWMNAANGYSTGIMKATQTLKQPRHIHPYPFTFVVLEGSVVTSDENGKDHEYGPGSVVYRAANEPHQTTVKQGAVVFSVGTGPMMNIPVDDKGQPLPQHAQK